MRAPAARAAWTAQTRKLRGSSSRCCWSGAPPTTCRHALEEGECQINVLLENTGPCSLCDLEWWGGPALCPGQASCALRASLCSAARRTCSGCDRTAVMQVHAHIIIKGDQASQIILRAGCCGAAGQHQRGAAPQGARAHRGAAGAGAAAGWSSQHACLGAWHPAWKCSRTVAQIIGWGLRHLLSWKAAVKLLQYNYSPLL